MTDSQCCQTVRRNGAPNKKGPPHPSQEPGHPPDIVRDLPFKVLPHLSVHGNHQRWQAHPTHASQGQTELIVPAARDELAGQRDGSQRAADHGQDEENDVVELQLESRACALAAEFAGVEVRVREGVEKSRYDEHAGSEVGP